MVKWGYPGGGVCQDGNQLDPYFYPFDLVGMYAVSKGIPIVEVIKMRLSLTPTVSTIFLTLCSALALAVDSDDDGISDAIEASNGADPFSKYAVSAGSECTCALDDDGITCWGANGDGQSEAP